MTESKGSARGATGSRTGTLIAVGLVTAIGVWSSGCDAISSALEDALEPPVRTVTGVTTDVAAIVGTFAAGPQNTPYLLESLSEFQLYYGGAQAGYEASFHVRAFFDNGGQRIWVVRVGDDAGATLIGNQGAATGMYALVDANRFDLLLVPELFSAQGQPGARSVYAAQAVSYAASRDAVFLLDPPAEAATAQQTIDWVNQSPGTVRSASAVMYFGRIDVAAAGGGSGVRPIGSSGAAAGVYSRNDRARGVWSVPAGPNAPLQGVFGVTQLTQAEMGSLTQAGINPIAPLSTGGIALFGGRTLSTDPELRYLNVQRMALHIDAAVRDELAWVKGSASDATLWSGAQSDAESVLQALFQQGAFQGAKASDAYFVRSDRTTNTAADIAAGRLIVLVGFAALRPAEFVVRTISITL